MLTVSAYVSVRALAQFTIPQIELPEISIPDPTPDAAPQYLRRDPWNFSRPVPAPSTNPQVPPANAPAPWDLCIKAPDPLTAVNACSEFAESESEPPRRRAEAFLVRARAYDAQNQTIAALADLSASIELNPKSSAAYYLRGVLWKHSQNYDQAIKDFTAGLALSPKSLQFLIERGVAYRGQKDARRSFADFDRALAIDPRSERAYYERGLTHLGIQEYSEAVADLERALALNPKFALSHYALGNVRYAMRDLPGAIHAYNEAVRIDPAIEVYVANARGRALLETGNCKAAIEDFNKVLVFDAKSPATLRNRARCLQRTGRYDEAAADFTRAIYINPDDATLFAERGNSFLYGKDVATAGRDLNHAFKLDPKNAVTLRNRARLHIVQKKFSEALADFDAALALEPSAEARAERLWIFIASGDVEAAQREAQAVLAQSPSDASALFARGYLKMKAGDRNSGKLDMVEAVKRDPELPARLSIFSLDF